MVRTRSASRALWRWPTTISASSLRDERSQVGGSDTNGIQDPNMRKLPTRAQAVDGRGAHSKPARDRGHGEQGALDPSWTRRFVVLQCCMGDSWIGLCYRPE